MKINSLNDYKSNIDEINTAISCFMNDKKNEFGTYDNYDGTKTLNRIRYYQSHVRISDIFCEISNRYNVRITVKKPNEGEMCVVLGERPNDKEFLCQDKDLKNNEKLLFIAYEIITKYTPETKCTTNCISKK